MIIEFFEITLGLITVCLIFFLLYSFIGVSRKSQASKTSRNTNNEQFKEFEQEFGEEEEPSFEQSEESEGFASELDYDDSDPLLSESDIEEDKLEPSFGEVEESISESVAEPVINEAPIESDVSVSQATDESAEVNERSRLISVYILANGNSSFSGYDLLQSLLASGLRFGEMNIFHRHEDSNGSGKVLFSLASATEPGTFNVQNMGSFNGKGLCMFMQVRGSDKDNEVFELFIKTAQKLSDELNGSIYDDSRHPLTKDSLHRYQRVIRAAKKESEPFELA